MKTKLLMAAVAASITVPAIAGPENFKMGPVFTDAGAVAAVDSDLPVSKTMDYKIRFDIPAGEAGARSKKLDSVARTINMLAANGVPRSKIQTAVVVHNSGVWDVVDAPAYAAHYGGAENPNAPLVRALIAKGVPIYVCGQSSAMLGVPKSALIPGVKVALSAIHAHADLNAKGYALNPF
jgi:intracellular sulfur oxidation DsrE/DsrF family protein